MKTNYLLKSAFIIALCCFAFQLNAENLINGINYNIIDDGAAVEVAPLPKDGEDDVRYDLAEITIPATVEIDGTTYPVKKIGDNALRNNNNLVSLTLPEGLEVIGNSSLAECESLPSLVVPSTVKSIEDWSFYGCFALESINIPDGITAITEHTFQNTGLKSVVLPESVTSLKVCAFQDAKDLASINLENIREIIDWSMYGTAITSAVLTDVERIGNVSFGRIPTLISVELNNIGEIADWAFQDCTNLESLKMSDVEVINTGAFSGCSSLTEVEIPNSVVFINGWAFEKTGITKVYASWADPEEDVVIDENAFGADEGKADFKWYVPESVYWDWDDFFMGYLVELDERASLNSLSFDNSAAYYTQGALSLNNLNGYQITVYSVDGKAITHLDVVGDAVQLPISLQSGVYMLQAVKNAERGTVKFIVR